MKRHLWRIKDKYYQQHRYGHKDIEVRVGYPQIRKVQVGDVVTFENHEEDEFEVKRIATYKTFSDLLQCESVQRILPGATTDQALKLLKRIYPKSKENLGVYALELKFKSRKREFLSASELWHEKKLGAFSDLVNASYQLTDWISKDYPDHCLHFYGKYVPGIFSGSREIIACRIDSKLVAVAFLKKALEASQLGPNGHSEMERKLSTLFVDPNYRRQGIADELLQKSFAWLGTTKPLATIAEYKLDQFLSVIKKYNWQETQILEPGYYNNHHREHVFNGKI